MASIKKLNHKAWIVIQAKYEHGEPLRELAQCYGICISAISKRAKRHGWKKHGEMRKMAIEEAREKAHIETSASYKEIVKKTNEEHLQVFQRNRDLCRMIVNNIKARIEWAARENLRRERVALKEGLEPPQPVDLTRDTITLNHVVSCLNRTTEAERTILGIDTPMFVKDDENSGLMALVRCLEESRKMHFGHLSGCDSSKELTNENKAGDEQ